MEVVLVTDRKMVSKSVLDTIIDSNISRLLKRTFSSMDRNNYMSSLYFYYKLPTAMVTAKITVIIIAC